MRKASVSENSGHKSRSRGRKTGGSPESDGDIKSTVLSLAKGFRVLELFTATEPELNLSEIAKRAKLDTGTAFRIIRTLVMLGYLEQAEGVKRYRLALKVIDLGFNAIARMDLHSLARPVLRSLVSPICEAASIGVLDGPDVIYIDRVQAGFSPLGITRGIGSRVPAYCTAVGHAILAFLPLEQRLKTLNMRTRTKLTPNSLVTIAEIEERLAAVRNLGYAISDQALVLGVRALAAPILDREGYALAALSVGSSSFTSSLEEFTSIADQVLQGAHTLSRSLSVSGSSAVGFRQENQL